MAWGFMMAPPSATAEATRAICRGDAATLFWPMDDWANVAASRAVGKFERGRTGQVDRRLLVEAERLGAVDHLVEPDGLGPHLGERRVARHGQDREERAATRLGAEVEDGLADAEVGSCAPPGSSAG